MELSSLSAGVVLEVSIGLIRAMVKVKDSAKLRTVNRKLCLARQHGWTHSNSGGKGLNGFMIIPALRPVLSRILLMPILKKYFLKIVKMREFLNFDVFTRNA
jgi:hypothetical protein